MEPLSPLDCGAGALICNAASGYDGPTGVGSPDGIAAFEPGSEAEFIRRTEEEAAARTAKEAKEAEEAKAAKEAREANEAKEAKAAKEAEEARAARETREAEEVERTLERERHAEEERQAVKKIEAETAAAGGGSKSKGASGHEGGAGAGGGANANQPSAGADSSSTGSPAGAGGVGHSAIRLSNLALTARASTVIAHGLPTLSQIACSFVLSAPARVRVTLFRLVHLHGRPRWVSASGAFALASAKGRNRLHLKGHDTLAAGRYRLTLTPARGRARSIAFSLR